MESGRIGAKGRLDFTGPIKVTLAEGSHRPFHFCVATAVRTLHLQADSEAELLAWIAALEASSVEQDVQRASKMIAALETF